MHSVIKVFESYDTYLGMQYTIQYNTISFNGTKNTPADTDATEDGQVIIMGLYTGFFNTLN